MHHYIMQESVTLQINYLCHCLALLMSLDVPKLRQSDISFALTAVLNTLWPPSVKAVPLTVQKPPTDLRTGSLTFAARDPKTLTKTSLTLYQVAFLGKDLYKKHIIQFL